MTWEEATISFWITLPCIVIGLILLVIPTVYLIHWVCRLFIWICLGPWLRIYYELFVFENHNPLSFESDECRSKHARKMSQRITDQFKKIAIIARIKGEDAIKMKSMRTLRFGKHIAKVPSLNLTRHYDFPLSESTASHVSSVPEHKLPMCKQLKHIPSQRLVGNMIPMTEEQMLIFNSNLKAGDVNTENHKERNNSEKAVVPSIKVESILPDVKKVVKEQYGEKNDAKVWLNNAITHLRFKGQVNIDVSLKESTHHDDESEQDVLDDSIEIDVDDNIIHISTCNVIVKDDDCDNDGDDDDDDDSNFLSLYETDYEEEGLEIIVCDGDSDVPDDIRDDLCHVRSDVTECSLSTVYHCADGVYVAYCRSGITDSETAD